MSHWYLKNQRSCCFLSQHLLTLQQVQHLVGSLKPEDWRLLEQQTNAQGQVQLSHIAAIFECLHTFGHVVYFLPVFNSVFDLCNDVFFPPAPLSGQPFCFCPTLVTLSLRIVFAGVCGALQPRGAADGALVSLNVDNYFLNESLKCLSLSSKCASLIFPSTHTHTHTHTLSHPDSSAHHSSWNLFKCLVWRISFPLQKRIIPPLFLFCGFWKRFWTNNQRSTLPSQLNGASAPRALDVLNRPKPLKRSPGILKFRAAALVLVLTSHACYKTNGVEPL